MIVGLGREGFARGGRDGLLVSVLLPFTTFSILCYEIILTRLFAYIFTNT